MGMDVEIYSGVIANFDQMVGIIQKDKDKVFEVTSTVKKLDEDFEVVESEFLEKISLKMILLEAIWDWVHGGEETNDVETTLKSAWEISQRFQDAGGEDGPGCPTWDEAIEALKDAAAVNDDDADYFFIPAEEELLGIWNEILGNCYPDLPQVDEVRCFCNGRLQGYDVPTGEACFIFGTEELFEKKLTEKGEDLKKAIGHCNESEWTVVTY